MMTYIYSSLKKKMILIIAFFLLFVTGCSSKYVPMVLEPIDLSLSGYNNKYVFTNKYQGSYNIGLYVEKPAPPFGSYETKFRIELTIYQNQIPILNRQLIHSEFNFNGWEKGKGGMVLLKYSSPSDLPTNQLLTCSVTVVDSDGKFEEKYGKPMFFIRKMSDK